MALIASTGGYQEVDHVKPGGVIGVRDMDTGGIVYAPDRPVLEELGSLIEKQMRHNGGDPQYGRRLSGALREEGFRGIEVSASYSSEDPTRMAQAFGRRVTEPPLSDLAVQNGWADRVTLEKIATDLKTWSEHPDAFFLLSRCAAVGWKVRPLMERVLSRWEILRA